MGNILALARLHTPAFPVLGEIRYSFNKEKFLCKKPVLEHLGT